MKRTRAGWAAGLVLLAPLLVLPAIESSSAATSAAAGFAGANGLIAFSSDRDGDFAIYVMHPDGSDVRRLTSMEGDEYNPAWSPDGRRIAFAAGDWMDESIYVMNADGSGLTQLTDVPGRDFSPAWSPDGTRIVFSSDRDRESAHAQIWVMDADGSDEELLIDAPPAGHADDPAWSPNGRRIAYAFTATGTVGVEIAVADADGTDRRTLAAHPDGTGQPDWSPDGTRIAYMVRDDSGENHNLRLLEVDSGGHAPLTDTGERDLRPAWSPDGQTIAFSRDDPSPGIWLMAADGSDPRPLLQEEEVIFWQPSWQPVLSHRLSATPAATHATTGALHTVGFQLDDGGAGFFSRGIDLLVEVTGTHPQTATAVTDVAGQATYSWTGSETGTDTLTVCADLDDDTRCAPDEPRDTVSVTWEPESPFDEPRLAFTDERDALHQTTVTRSDDGFESGSVSSFEPGATGHAAEPVHEGELSALQSGPRVFVSTRHSPQGEIYLASAFSPTPTRITCDTEVETHPVVAPDGSIAFAAVDGGDDGEGDWDIYLASPPPPILLRPAPAWGTAAGPTRPGAHTTAGCGGWTIENLTDEADGTTLYDDLWPAFVDGARPRELVFSRAERATAEDPGGLSDLWRVSEDDGEWTASSLTSTVDVAESQPDVARFFLSGTSDGPGPAWIAYTTTEHRPDGSVELLRLFDGAEFDLWSGTRPPQGSEPSLGFRTLAMTTTRGGDPYGGIWAASIRARDPDAEDLEPVARGLSLVADDPGVAESHPSWLTEFATEPDSGVTSAGLGFTARVRRDLAWDDDRLLDADVSDVLATDGSQRRVVIDEVAGPEAEIEGFRYDEAGPAYSPDGRQFAFSTSDDAAAAGAGTGREIRIASWDGIDVTSLAELTRHGAGDIDRDPVWSPDGTKIAFVREDWYRPPPTSPTHIPEPRYLEPRVWVVDLDSGRRPRPITPASTPDVTWADWDPAWSPDGTQLVVARELDVSIGRLAHRGDRVRTARVGHESTETELWVVPADASGVGERLEYHECPDECGYLPVEGGHPAWSPDGSTIAYAHAGQIQTIAFFGEDDDVPCCATPGLRPVQDPAAVTGFEEIGWFRNPRTPTPTRAVLSWTDDPAWAPDGSEIVFSGQQAGQPDQRDIWAIEYDPVEPSSGELRQITGRADDEDGTVDDGRGPETEPAWQPPPFPADVSVSVGVTGSPAVLDEPMVATFTVTNNGPGFAEDVVLTTGFTAGAEIKASPPRPAGCRVDGTGCQFAVLDAGESRVYLVNFSHAEPLLGTATGDVRTTTEEPDDLSNNIDSAPYEVVAAPDVAVKVKVDEDVGYVGGFRTARIVVHNRGVGTAEGVTLTATWPEEIVATAAPVPDALPTTPTCLLDGDPCDLGDLAEGEKVAHRVSLEALAEGLGTIDAEISTETTDPDPENDADSAELEILQPTVRVLPAVARPGEVVLAYAENMPPGDRIRLDWSTPDGDTSDRYAGIMVDPGALRVGRDGTARTPLVIVRRDVLGDRLLVATSTTDAFSPVTGPLLVTLRPLAAPQLLGRG